MTAKHWILTAYVLVVATIALFAQQNFEHPKTAYQVALEQASERARWLRDSTNKARRAETLDAYCAMDFGMARDHHDTLEVIKGHGPIFERRDGACYVDAERHARWRP